jgi:hypothetical protein
MKKALLLLLFVSSLANAYASHPSRIRLLIHDAVKVDSTLELRTHLIPSGNLVGEIKPLVYLGLGWRATTWLDIEPAVGWAFDNDEPITSLRIMTLNKVWTWTDVELQSRTLSYYWFSQTNYNLTSWCQIGAETEGWGRMNSKDAFSYGLGPNMLLRFKQAGLDIALHYREMSKKTGSELVLRFHLFLQ